MRWAVLLFSACLAVVAATTTSACPICDTGTGEQVRAGILDEHFGRTFIAILLPFPILLGVVAMIHFGWPFRADSPDNSPARSET